MRPFLFCALTAFLIFGQSASPALIFDNGLPNGANGSEIAHYMEADDFVLFNPTRIDSVTFWEVEKPGYFTGNVLWEILSDTGGNGPGKVLYSGLAANVSHVATGVALFGAYQEFVNSFPVVPISLPPGTYWLALHDGPLSNNADSMGVYWEASASANLSPSRHQVSPFTGGWYANVPPDLAFQLNGVMAPSLPTLDASENSVDLSFSTSAGYYYQAQFKDNMTDAKWQAVPGAEAILGNGSDVQVSDPGATKMTRAQRFYRAALTYNIPTPTLSAVIRNGNPLLTFSSVSGYYYRVEYKDNLTDASWQPVTGANSISGSGGPIQIVDPSITAGASSKRFYRVSIY